VAYGEVEYRERPRRRWGSRILVTLLVLLIVLAVLVVVADRVGASVAERRVAEEVSQELTARAVRSSPPEVSIGGFPFLTQVLAEHYDEISIGLRDVTADSAQVGAGQVGAGQAAAIRLPRLDVVASDVDAPLDTLRGGSGAIVAGTVEGTATVSYASVAQLIDQPGLRLAERGGRLLANLPVRLLGQEFTLTGEAEIEARDGKIRVRFQELDAEGLPTNDLVRAAVNDYARQLAIDVAVPALPFGIQVTEVQALPEGLAISATASDVPLNQPAG